MASEPSGDERASHRTARRLDPAKPEQMSQGSGGKVELADVGGDRLIDSVDVAA
jgi:hypothetical protein